MTTECPHRRKRRWWRQSGRFRCLDCGHTEIGGETHVPEPDVEDLARELCDTYYLTVNTAPEMKMRNAYSKITEATREHWRAQAALLLERGWRR